MLENNSIASTVDKVRERIRQVSDDSPFTDELIYATLLDIRSELLHRELNKRKHRSKFLYKTICMPLVKSSDIPCDCIPDCFNTCMALKSKYELPEPFSSIFDDVINVLSLDGARQYTYKEVRYGKYNKYSRVMVNPYYTIYNDYLYIIDHKTNRLPAILIEMIPEDPLSVSDISLCDPNGNEIGDSCFDVTKDTFNLKGHLKRSLINMAVQELVPSITLPEDVTNDAISVPEQSRI